MELTPYACCDQWSRVTSGICGKTRDKLGFDPRHWFSGGVRALASELGRAVRPQSSSAAPRHGDAPGAVGRQIPAWSLPVMLHGRLLGVAIGLWPRSFAPRPGSRPVRCLQQRQGRRRGGLGSGRSPPGPQMESESGSPTAGTSPSAVSLPSLAQQSWTILT